METTLTSSTASASFDRAAERARVEQERRRSSLLDLAITLATIAFALLIGFLIILLVGRDAMKAYEALLTGPITRLGRTGRWLEVATNLTIVGLAVAIPFRARQFSLGAEGQILIGAMAAAVVAIYVPMPPLIAIILPIIAAMIAGFLLGLLPGLMKAYLNANEIVSTLMLNTIVLLFYDFILTYVLKPPGAQTTQSERIQANSELASFFDLTRVDLGNFNTGVFIAILAVIAVWLLLTRTPFGYEIRIIGSNEKFARYGGINTKRTIALSFAIGGAVAALAGVHLALGVHQRLLLAFTGGLGFSGIIVALLARNNPLIVPIAALFYAYLLVGGDRVEQAASVGSELVQVIQAVIMLLLTTGFLIEFVRARRNVRRKMEQTAQKVEAG